MRSFIIATLVLLSTFVAVLASAQDCDWVAAARQEERRPPTSDDVGHPFSYTVGGAVNAPILKRFVSPTYPLDALRAHYQGSVALRVIVGKDGVPLKVEISRGLDFGLGQAAADAVKQWRFAPGQLNGRPVPVHILVEILFDYQRGGTTACVE